MRSDAKALLIVLRDPARLAGMAAAGRGGGGSSFRPKTHRTSSAMTTQVTWPATTMKAKTRNSTKRTNMSSIVTYRQFRTPDDHVARSGV